MHIYKTIQVDYWTENVLVQASGTRSKKWMINPDTGNQVLIKWPNHGLGEIYAEKICSELGKVIGIKVMNVDIGSYRGKPVVLAYNFLHPGEELKEGGDFFERYQSSSGKLSLAPGYTYQRIKEIVAPYGLLNNLVDMLVFDCLVTNSDRHQDNWGLCFKDEKVRFAPLYDHGSSLGWNLSEEEVNNILLDSRRFKGFLNRGKSLVGWEANSKINHFQLISNILYDEPTSLINTLQKISAVDEISIGNVIKEFPDDMMSELRKEFIIRLLLERKALLERLLN